MGSENGSPSATSVVIVVVVVVVVVIKVGLLTLVISLAIVIKLRTQIGDKTHRNRTVTDRPVESQSGARETIIVGPYHNFRTCWQRGVEREETWEGCPLIIRLGAYGSVVSSFSGFRGRKWISCIFEAGKQPSGTPFSVFLSVGGAPKTSRGPGKFSPLFPLSTGLDLEFIVCKFGGNPAIYLREAICAKVYRPTDGQTTDAPPLH